MSSKHHKSPNSFAFASDAPNSPLTDFSLNVGKRKSSAISTPSMSGNFTPSLGSSMTPSFLPRRSPRLNAATTPLSQALSTPMFSMSSPTLPSILTNNPFELRRSPPLKAMAPIGGAYNSHAKQQSHSLSLSHGHTSSSSASSHSHSNAMKNSPGSGMSILNRLQHSNNLYPSSPQQSRKKHRRGSQDIMNKFKTKDGDVMFDQYTPESGPSPVPPMDLPEIAGLQNDAIINESSNDANQNNFPKSSGNGSGSSCHQCKSRRSMNNLIFCSNMFTKRSKEKRRNKEKRHVCRKKYCDQCLAKFYHEKAPSKRQDPSSTWLCPACRKICCCAACRRQKAKSAAGADHLTMSPATSLACGLVYFKDMLKFKLSDPANPELQKALKSLNNGEGPFKNGLLHVRSSDLDDDDKGHKKK